MAIEVTIDATIARPPAEVFDRIAALETWPTWLIASGIIRVARAAEGPPTVGERLVVDQRAAGRAGTFEVTVTEVEPGTRLALGGRDGDGVTIDIVAQVGAAEAGTAGTGVGAPADAAATALRWTIRIGLPFRYRVFESMARPQVERAAALDIEALRRRMESAAAD